MEGGGSAFRHTSRKVNPPRLLQQLEQQGITFEYVRDEIYWAQLENRRPGEFNWSYCDDYVDRIARSGHGLLLTVNWSNPLFRRSSEMRRAPAPRNGIDLPDTPEQQMAFADYVMAVLERYAKPGGERYRAGLIEAVEVWNEANGSWSGGLPIGPGDGGVPAILTALTKTVFQRIRSDRAFDSIPVLGGAAVLIPRNYIRWLLDAGLGSVVDGIVVHPYMPAEEIIEQAGAVRRLLDERGLQRVGIWATEYGGSKTAPLFLKNLDGRLCGRL